LDFGETKPKLGYVPRPFLAPAWRRHSCWVGGDDSALAESVPSLDDRENPAGELTGITAAVRTLVDIKQ